MSYVTLSLIHKITTELATGMLTLAFLCMLSGYTLRLIRYRNTPGRRVALLDGAALVASIGGTAALVLSVSTGLFTWPWQRLWATEIVYGKVGLALVALALWSMVLLYRLQFGPVLRRQRLSPVPLFLALAGFGCLILTASAGGHLAHGRSLMDPLIRWLGINPYAPWVWPPLWGAGAVTGGVVSIVLTFLLKRNR